MHCLYNWAFAKIGFVNVSLKVTGPTVLFHYVGDYGQDNSGLN